jgi:FAD/FMN-containing dehydrogenase
LKLDPDPISFQCASLASHLPSSVFLAKTGNFDFWDTKQSDLTPACRVEPSSSEEVSLVLKTVINTKCHFAIKSGGHDRTPGSSNAVGGITIDLVRLNGVNIAEDEKSVKIGAGLRWLDVYTALERENLTVVGGRVSDVGVGGLTLGGR